MPRAAASGSGRGVRGRFNRLIALLWRRGATESALLLLAAAVASGVVFGAGVARASSRTSDGQTWVARSDSGTVVQINPVTGQPVTEVNVGLSAGPKQVEQGDGVVLVTDPTTGRSVSVDVGRLLVTGSRTDDPATTKQLYADGQAYVADLTHGVVRAIDPLSLADEGQAYSAGSPFSDVVADSDGIVWALGTDGMMTSLHWSAQARRFVDKGATRVTGAGAGAKLAAHPSGVTVFAPGTGVIVQVGTGSDVAATVPGLSGQVLPAATSPQDLTAAAVPGTALTVILSGTSVYAAHMAADGCDRPGRPAVFGGKVYVPCGGGGRTVVLGPDGRKAGPDIGDGGNSTPVLTQDPDSLVIVTDNGTAAVTVDAQGGIHTATLGGDGMPVVVAGTSAATAAASPATSTGPSASAAPPSAPLAPSPPSNVPATPQTPQVPPAAPPPAAPDPVAPAVPWQNRQPRSHHTTSSSHRADPVTGSAGGRPDHGPVAPPAVSDPCGHRCDRLGPATGVVAAGAGVGGVRVTWTPPRPAPQAYRVQTVDGGALTTAEGSASELTITGLAPGTSDRFVVIADFGVTTRTSVASNTVVVPNGDGAPNPPSDGPVSANPPSDGPVSADPPDVPVSANPPSDGPVSADPPDVPVSANPPSDGPVSADPPPDPSPDVPVSPPAPPDPSPDVPVSPDVPPPPPAPSFPAVTGLSVSPGTGIISSVKVGWNAPAGRAPTSYHVVGTIDGSGVSKTADVTATSTTLAFGAYPAPQAVTVSVTAVYPDGSADAATAHGETNPSNCTTGGAAGLRGPGAALGRVALPPCLPPPTCTQPSGPHRPSSPYPCQIQAAIRGAAPAGDAPAGVASTGVGAAGGAVSFVPAVRTGRLAAADTGDPFGGVRYAAAAGLIALAGLIRFGRYRLDDLAVERDPDGRRAQRGTRRSRKGTHR